MKKRELFGSLASFFKREEGSKIITRPPYYSAESNFNNCIKCDGKCANVCEENIIIIQKDKTPCLDFSQSGCTYCDKCALACDLNVLEIENKSLINTKIKIDMLKCISWSKTMCFSCKDVCLENAIIFSGLFRPEIDYEKCTNCGFCIKVCPVNAIKVAKWQ